ncbi:MAG: right-handed parallel beta-helix repeat-containing protein [Chloroflexi bacterium]|nr:right-handed parallel beta-helix repeat-containing protein [Chloroflexota bacterium]
MFAFLRKARGLIVRSILFLALIEALAWSPQQISLAESVAGTDRYVKTTSPGDAGDCTDPSHPCQTIQYAIGKANPGDTIHLVPGITNFLVPRYTFNEHIIIDKNLTLIGDEVPSYGSICSLLHPCQMTIDGGGEATPGHVVQIDQWADNVSISNVVIRNGYLFQTSGISIESGAGIYIVSGPPTGLVTLSNVIIEDNLLLSGADAGGTYGGGIRALSRDLTLDHVIVRGNRAGNGAGIVYSSPSGTLTVTNSTVEGNTADNAGGISIYEDLHASITDSAISGNSGGGIEFHGEAVLKNVTISGNTDGFGLIVYGDFNPASVSMENVTVSDNSFFDTAGIHAYGHDGEVTCNHCTVANNISTRSIYPSQIYAEGGAKISLTNTLVVGTGNLCAQATAGILVSLGHNMANGATCNLSAAGDLLTMTPDLGELVDNGGPTQTMALLLGSPAIDGADNSGPLADQRGISRMDGDLDGVVKPDIGAYEYVPPPVYLYLPFVIQ